MGVIAALCSRVLSWFIPVRLFETEIELQMWLVDRQMAILTLFWKNPDNLTARRKKVCETSLL
jgi:hypothetical protein